MYATIAHAVADSAKLTTLGDDVVPRLLSGRARVDGAGSEKVTFLVLSASRAIRVAEGTRVNRIPRLRLVDDDAEECFDINRHETNIRPCVAEVRDVIKPPIDDHLCYAWPATHYTIRNSNRS